MLLEYLVLELEGKLIKSFCKALSFRELEYLEFIRKKNILLYGEVLEKLRYDILGPNAPNDSDNMPLYPNLRKDHYDEKGPGYQL